MLLHRFTVYAGRSRVFGAITIQFLGVCFLQIYELSEHWPLSNARKVLQKFGMTHIFFVLKMPLIVH